MAKKSSVSTLAAMPIGPDCDEHSSVSVSCRKIDNGFIVSRSECRNGEYKHSEEFSKDKPDLEVRGERSNVGRETMRDAKKYLSE